MARILAAVKKMGVKIGWLDKVIRDICVRRDHLILTQKEKQFSTWLVELHEEIGRVQQMLVDICSEKSIKNFPPILVGNYKIYITADN